MRMCRRCLQRRGLTGRLSSQMHCLGSAGFKAGLKIQPEAEEYTINDRQERSPKDGFFYNE